MNRSCERVLRELGLSDESVVLRSTTASIDDDADRGSPRLGPRRVGRVVLVVRRATRATAIRSRWRQAFGAVVELVHDWRRFPFIDPELPTELLPDRWAGATAASTFHERHAAWSPAAQRWFDEIESG